MVTLLTEQHEDLYTIQQQMLNQQQGKLPPDCPDKYGPWGRSKNSLRITRSGFGGKTMTDRLAEIEANLSDGSYTWGRYSDEHHDADNDVQWLIEEVKRLRELCNRPETTSRKTYDRRG